MLKVCTSYSKKVPAGEQYSSQQFHASVELELSDTLRPEELQDRLHQTFDLVKSTVEEEINGGAPVSRDRTPRNTTADRNRVSGASRNGENNKATNAQIKYMTSLAGDQGIQLSALNQHVKDEYGVDSLYELSKHDASKLVDGLKHGRIKIAA